MLRRVSIGFRTDCPVNLKTMRDVFECFDDANKHLAIPWSQVQEWMKSDDIEVLGAVFELMNGPDHHRRITPHPVLDDYLDFNLKYYARCIQDDPEGEWCDSRYLACHSFTNWLKHLWRDEGVERQVIWRMKEFVEGIYLAGGSEIKEAVILGMLEHLLGEKEYRDLFADWETREEFSSAFRDACSLAKRVRN